MHDLAEARHIAEKLRRRAAEPVVVGDATIAATLSVGVTLVSRRDTDDAVIARADAALYEAKHSGRNQVVTFPPRA